jgi:rubrerythrin/uncharacterized membrane protein
MAKWRCTICGYAHEGEEAPAQCPVCGADRSKFERLDGTDRSAKDSPGAPENSPPPVEPERWQCAVCGYIHTGDEPPDPCPVCGAESRHFTGLEASPASLTPTSAPSTGTAAENQRWRCIICGYIHVGPEPPEICPVCGADRSKFELVEDAAETTATEDEKPAPSVDDSATEKPTAKTYLDRYRPWIDLAIEYHAHPIAVHIPNGVLPITVAMVLLAALFDWPAIGQASVYNMGFTFLSMPVVLFTGYLHWQYKFGGNMTDLFKWKIICGVIVTVLSGLLFVWGLADPASAHDPGAVYLLLHIVLLVVAGIAGWLGGKLVFRPGH